MTDLNSKLRPYNFLFLAIVFWFLIFSQTLYSMLEIWWRSDTFAHGFLIFPISLYLIYQKRSLFHEVEKQTSLVFLLLLFLSVFLWVIAKAVDVIVVQQLMVVIMLPLITGSLYGFKLVKQYLFPFCYLLFSVPIGEFLVPKLQQITASITVLGLELSNIPVFHEGMFISVPSGDFEVAVACSGIRYLIASLALGTLYAYLMYSSYKKRILFILASIAVPIIANGIRAYGIVLIAHLSDMKYATGVDHLIYGWLFFGFVIFILFYIGSFWEDKQSLEGCRYSEARRTFPLYAANRKPTAFLVGIVVVLSLGPLYSVWMQHYQQAAITSSLALSTPGVSSNWSDANVIDGQWKPIFINADKEVRLNFESKHDKRKVYFYKNEYLFETQGKELINTMNTFYDIKKWIVVSQKTQGINSSAVIEYNLRSNQGKLVVWGWYEVLGFKLTNSIVIKIVQALGKISGQDNGGHFTAIATPYFDNIVDARLRLKSFYQQYYDNKKLSER